MSSLGSPSPFFLAGKKPYSIDRSLRFNSPDDAYLARTITSTGNRKTFTFSGWIKRSTLTHSAATRIFNCNITNNPAGSAGQEITQLGFGTDDTIYFAAEDTNDQGAGTTTTVYRDPAAWMHLLYVVDTTESAAADRIKIFVNGEQITLNFSHNVAQNADTQTNLAGNVMSLGAIYFNGVLFIDSPFYLAEANFIDGQALTPSSFTETDVVTGQLIPKKYLGTYGTNGFYLNFSDNSGTTATTLGKDSSGNDNNFTPYNFSVAAGVGNDSLEDTPTNNFCTLNPLSLKGAGGTFSNGNLDFTSDSNYSTRAANFVLQTGKWYWECTPVSTPSNAAPMAFGIVARTNYPIGNNSYIGYDPNGNVAGFGYFHSGVIKGAAGGGSTSGANLATGQTTFTQNDVIGLASDIPNGTLAFYKNGTLVYTITGINSDRWFPAVTGYGTGSVSSSNFGQRPFAHTPPTGHKALCSANLPTPVILRPNKHFGTINFSGNGNNNRTVTDANSVDFTPDFAWFKERTGNNWHGLVNSVIGSTQVIWTNSTDAEGTATNGVESFTENGMIVGDFTAINDSGEDYFAHLWNAGDTDGKTYKVVVVSDSGNKYRFRNSADDATFAQSAVTLDLAEGGTYVFDWSDSTAQAHPIRFSTTADGTHGGGSEYTTGVVKDDSAYKTTITVAASAPTLYYYCQSHSGMGGQVNTNSTTGSSNFDGSIQTTVKANPAAGFSIVSYSGNGTAGATIGHGLGVKPEARIVIRRNYQGKRIFGLDFGSGKDGHYIELSSAVAEQNNNNAFNSANPTSSTVVLGDSNATNNSGGTHIAYVFADVAGFSKSDFYVGNGSNDGTFVYTGFKPAFLLIKDTQGTDWWQLQNIKSFEGNPTNKITFPNVNNAEFTGSGGDVEKDILSNGFKLRGTSNGANKNNNYYYYLAFAESPFKNSRAV